MDLLDRLLGHDAWTTARLLEVCGPLTDAQLDCEFDIGHRTLRATLDHVVHNVEAWSALMARAQFERATDRTLAGMKQRAAAAHVRLAKVARHIAATEGWDATFTDVLETPPREKTFGAGIAHIITHSMHHRAQVLYMLRLTGIAPLPEGDVFSWEDQLP